MNRRQRLQVRKRMPPPVQWFLPRRHPSLPRDWAMVPEPALTTWLFQQEADLNLPPESRDRLRGHFLTAATLAQADGRVVVTCQDMETAQTPAGLEQAWNAW